MAHVAPLAALALLMIANSGIPGMNLMFVRPASNALAMVANGGFMPTSPKATAPIWDREIIGKTMAQTPVRHEFMDSSNKLPFLCDIIPAERPFVFVESVYSTGDVLLSLGCFIAIIVVMRAPLPSGRKAKKEA